jgi:hypothetical protein
VDPGRRKAMAVDPDSPQQRSKGEMSVFRVDHTPPPVLIEGGSLVFETDEPLDHTADGTQPHTHKHRRRTGERPILGLKILDDAGDTIYLDGQAAGSSVLIWWDRRVTREQILIDGATLNIEADVNLGAGADIQHPPEGAVKRIKQFRHPSTGGKGIEKVEIVTNGELVFRRSSRLFLVMIWDTAD